VEAKAYMTLTLCCIL